MAGEAQDVLLMGGSSASSSSSGRPPRLPQESGADSHFALLQSGAEAVTDSDAEAPERLVTPERKHQLLMVLNFLIVCVLLALLVLQMQSNGPSNGTMLLGFVLSPFAAYLSFNMGTYCRAAVQAFLKAWRRAQRLGRSLGSSFPWQSAEDDARDLELPMTAAAAPSPSRSRTAKTKASAPAPKAAAWKAAPPPGPLWRSPQPRVYSEPAPSVEARDPRVVAAITQLLEKTRTCTREEWEEIYLPELEANGGGSWVRPWSGSEEPCCSICMGEIARGAQVRGLACGHMFHMACLGSWFMKDANMEMVCPNCRTRIADQPKIQMEGLRGNDVSHFKKKLPAPSAKPKVPAYSKRSQSGVDRLPGPEMQTLQKEWEEMRANNRKRAQEEEAREAAAAAEEAAVRQAEAASSGVVSGEAGQAGEAGEAAAAGDA
eukprot:TRINITY_DN94500_c0_g1_i1.p1 TRINITY_DN94500_c0_g1~~TRINITY_DN94500_c0_g1_i1.p1  ORF type:complete len:431 (-),score=115.50 TRINITY_DN94500_c0_g1_i1:107-1399(-)